MTMSEHVRALSIRQPWAGLILAGTKDVENRTWTTPWRGVLVVHAGLRRDHRAAVLLAEHGYPTDPAAPTGAYLGAVLLTDVHLDRGDCCEWGEDGAYHWVLTRSRAFVAPVAGKGRLSLYRPPSVVVSLTALTHPAEAA